MNKKIVGILIVSILMIISSLSLNAIGLKSDRNIINFDLEDDWSPIASFFNKSNERNYNFISLKAKGNMVYSQRGHIGRLWLPNENIQISISSGEPELKIDGEIQDIETPVYIMLRRFFGFGPPTRNRNGRASFFGICGEIIVIPDDLRYDYIHKQRLFDVTDIKEFGQTAWGLTSADFNDDGDVDFAVSSATSPITHSTISIFYNNGDLEFTQEDVFTFDYSYINDLDSGDFDNDGDIDLMFTYSEYVWFQGYSVKINGTVNLLVNNGTNEYNNFTQVAWHGPGVPYGPENRINPQLASADYDMDGDIDFLVGDNSGKVEFYKNNGLGDFTSDGIINDWGHLSWGLTSGDFDGDGDIDFLVNAESQPYHGYIYLKRNQMIESNFTTCFESGPGELLFYNGGTGSLISIDYDEDGDLDFIAGIWENVFLLMNEQSFFDVFYLGILPPSEEGYRDALRLGAFTSSDYNNDEREDVIIGGVQGAVRLCISNYGQLPPLRPEITTPAWVRVDEEVNIKFLLKDINRDNVSLFVDWGDGTNSGWIGPYESGTKVVLKHTWDEVLAYHIKAKAKDDDGESSWKEYVLIVFEEEKSTSLELIYPRIDYYNGFLSFKPKKQEITNELKSVSDYYNNILNYQLYQSSNK